MKIRIIKKLDIITFSILVAMAIILINLFSLTFSKRLDLTMGQKYSLSATTKDKLKKLDDIVNIRAYFSKQLPPRFLSIRQEVVDFLNDYQLYSRGKMKVSYLDPLSSPDSEKEALSYGIPQLQFSDLEKDKFQVQNGFLGLVVLYEDRYEVLPIVENIQNLEYDLTSSIIKVLAKNKKTIALATLNDDSQAGVNSDEYKLLKSYLEKQYQIQPVIFNNQTTIDKSVNTLIIIGDKAEASENEKYQIDQFIMSGRGALFLINGISINENLSGSIAKHNLFDLLEFYGAKINSDLILDTQSDIASFQNGYTTFLIPYPFWPKINKDGFALKNPITAKLESLTFQWPSSISLNKNKQSANYEVLIKSSKKSWISPQISNLSPQQEFKPKESDFKRSNLVLLITGRLTSFFNNKETPITEAQSSNFASISPLKQTENSRVIIISSNSFIKDNFLSRNQEAMILVLNAVDYLSSETDLMQIRSKLISEQPLPELNDSVKQIIRWLNIFIPFLFIVLILVAKKIWETTKEKEIKKELS